MDKEELEKIIDNMYELQRKRILDINEKQIENLNIKDIIYLGKVRMPNTEDGQILEKEIYVSIEEKDGKIAYKYFDENQELLAIEQEGKQNINGELIKEIKNNNNSENELSLKEIEEKQSDKDKEDDKKQVKEDEKVEIPLEQEVTSKVTKKEDVDLNQIQQGETLRNLLGLSGEYTKIVLVSSSEVNKFLPSEQRKINKDCFIAVKSSGEGMVLGEDILEYDSRSGINPREENSTINIDGKVNKKQVTSRYKIVNGNGNQYLSVGHDEAVGKEVKFSEWSNQYGTYIDTELETNRIQEQEIDKYVRKLKYEKAPGQYNADDKQERVNEEEEYGCEETDVTKVDNNKNNDSHMHEEEIENKKNDQVEQAIQKILENDTISNNYTEKEVREYFAKKLDEGEMTIEEITKYIEEDLERTAPIQDRKL